MKFLLYHRSFAMNCSSIMISNSSELVAYGMGGEKAILYSNDNIAILEDILLDIQKALLIDDNSNIWCEYYIVRRVFKHLCESSKLGIRWNYEFINHLNAWTAEDQNKFISISADMRGKVLYSPRDNCPMDFYELVTRSIVNFLV